MGAVRCVADQERRALHRALERNHQAPGLGHRDQGRPNTAYANARVTAKRLGNAVLLTHLGYGHISFVDPSRCVTAAYRRYLVRLAPPARRTVCPSDRGPFDPNFGEPLS